MADIKFAKMWLQREVLEPTERLFELSRKSFKVVKDDIVETNAKISDYFEEMCAELGPYNLSRKELLQGAQNGLKQALENTRGFVESIDPGLVQKNVRKWAEDAYLILEKEDVQTIYGFATLPILVLSFLFARYFPVMTAVLTRSIGKNIYVRANFEYDAELTKFDDSFLTWGTDFALAGVMGYLGNKIIKTKVNSHNRNFGRLGATLMITYSMSTFVGAFCHLFFSDLKYMNTWLFRQLWRVCVGTVAISGGAMGSVASELAKLSRHQPVGQFFAPPVVPHFVWFSWSTFFFGVVFWGLFSMKQPASDIFLTGVTQVIPTVYLVLVLYSRKNWKDFNVANGTRQIFLFGALANVPLLPGYDLFNFLNLPLGIINLILHTNLGLAWSSQGYSIYKVNKNLILFSFQRTCY